MEAKLKPLLKLCMDIDTGNTQLVKSKLFFNVLSTMGISLPMTPETMTFIKGDRINYLDAIERLHDLYCPRDEAAKIYASKERVSKEVRDRRL